MKTLAFLSLSKEEYVTSLVSQMVKRLPTMQQTQVQSLGQEDLLEPTPVLLPEKSYGQRSLVGYSPWGRKESDMTERLHFVERGVAVPVGQCA